MEQIRNYIAGELAVPTAKGFMENWAPATGTAYSVVPDSDETDVNHAVEAAARAFPAWSAQSAEARAKVLRRLAELIEGNLEDLARAESIDNGKPLSLA